MHDFQPGTREGAYEVAEFYSALGWAFLHLEQLEAYSKDRLVPALGREDERFYDTDGQLRADWRWYYDYNERLLAA